jgi:hypothetical protein
MAGGSAYGALGTEERRLYGCTDRMPYQHVHFLDAGGIARGYPNKVIASVAHLAAGFAGKALR